VESESKYRILVEEINDGYFVTQRGVIVFANQAFCNMHGYTLPEITGKPYTELVAEKSLRIVQRIYEKGTLGEVTDDVYTYFRCHKNGSTLPTENKIKSILYQGEYAVAGTCRTSQRGRRQRSEFGNLSVLPI